MPDYRGPHCGSSVIRVSRFQALEGQEARPEVTEEKPVVPWVSHIGAEDHTLVAAVEREPVVW